MHEKRAHPIECFAVLGYNVLLPDKRPELQSDSSADEDYYSATDALDLAVEKSIDDKRSFDQEDGPGVGGAGWAGLSHGPAGSGHRDALKKDHPISDRVYEPSVLCHYPDGQLNDSPARSLPKHVEIFCFPRGVRLVASESEPQASWHSFVMTDERGDRIYGVSAIVYMSLASSPLAFDHFKRKVDMWRETNHTTEEIEFYHANQGKIAELESSLQRLKDASGGAFGRQALDDSVLETQELIRLYGQLIDQTFHPLTFLLDGTKVWIPLCLTLLSREPYFGLMKNCISVLKLHYFSREHGVVPPQPSQFLVQVLEELPCAPSGKIELQIPVLLDAATVLNIYYSRPALNQHPMLLDLPMYPIFLCLSLRHLILVYERMLAEGRVILLSHNRNLLVSVAESLMVFLWPFYWLHVYIPLLPRSALSTLYAPVPYLIGLETAADEPESSLEIWRALRAVDGLIVCLDEDSLIDQSQEVGLLRHHVYEEAEEVHHSQSYLAYHSQSSQEAKRMPSSRSISIYSNHSSAALRAQSRPRADAKEPCHALRLPSHTRKKLSRNLKKASAELQLLRRGDYRNKLYDSLTLLHTSAAAYTPLVPRKCPLDLIPGEHHKRDRSSGLLYYSPSLRSTGTLSSAPSSSPALSGASSLTKIGTRSELPVLDSQSALACTALKSGSAEQKKSPFKKFLKKTRSMFKRKPSPDELDAKSCADIVLEEDEKESVDETSAAPAAAIEGHVFIDFPASVDTRWAVCSLCCRSLPGECLFLCRLCGLVRHTMCYLPENDFAFTICDFHAKNVLAAFLKIFTELFQSYRKFLLLPPDGDDLLKVSDLDTLFDKKKFVAETASSRDRRLWLAMFLETQMFNQFSYERAVTSQLDYGSLYFDEMIKEKVNRSIVKFQKDKVPFLKDQTYRIQSTVPTPATNIQQPHRAQEDVLWDMQYQASLFYPLLGRFRKGLFLPPRNVQTLIDDVRLVSDYKLYTLSLNRNSRLNQWKKKKKNARLLEMNVSSLSSSTCSLEKRIPIFDLKMDSLHSSVSALLQKYRAYEAAAFGVVLAEWSALRSAFLDCHADLIHVMNEGIVDKSRIVEIKYLLGLIIDHITWIDAQLLVYHDMLAYYLQMKARREWTVQLPSQIAIHYM